MANKTISGITTEATYALGADLIESEQAGGSVKIRAARLLGKLKANVVTGNTTFSSDDVEIIVNAATATITLPALDSSNPGRVCTVRKVSAGAGTVTIAAAGSDTITSGGMSSVSLTVDGDFLIFKDVGSRWDIETRYSTTENTPYAVVERSSTGYIKNPVFDSKDQIYGTLNKTSRSYSTAVGANIFPSAFGDVPISGFLHVSEIGTTNSLILACSKESLAAVVSYKVLKSSGLTVVGTNALGTITITGYTDTNNIRMVSEIIKVS